MLIIFYGCAWLQQGGWLLDFQGIKVLEKELNVKITSITVTLCN
jgi:hypothetical protein